jgi:OFA family oxalate/formate antiporter-like MFS transporter
MRNSGYLDINTNNTSNNTTDNKSSSNNRIKRRFPNNLTAREALRTSNFYFIYIMIFINVACGLAIIASASPLMQEVLDYNPMQAAAAVGLIGIFNGLGRFIWSSLSDYIGRINVYILFFSFQLIAFFTLASINKECKEWLFLFMIFSVVTIYGGGFACLPAFLSDLFGIKQLGAIHGLVLTAWGFAGFFGPSIYDFIKDYSGSLENTLQSFCILLCIAFLAAIALKTSMNQKSKQDQLLENALN